MALPQEVQDCVIVGGGPAGLTAALYLARFLRLVTVIDAGEGRARMIPRTHNQPLFPQGIAGPEMLAIMRRHAVAQGAQIAPGKVAQIAPQAGLFRLAVEGARGPQVVLARRVILATGVFNHRPPLPVAEHDAGVAAGLIRYCPVCDGYEVRGRRIAVLGQGRHGFDEARFIRTYARDVTLIPPSGLSGTAGGGIAVPEVAMRHLGLSGDAVIVTLANGAERRFDTLYVALGTTPCAGLATALGLDLTPEGHVVVDARQRTTMAGIYAIGDLTEGLDQIAVAMGQGAVAATAVHNDLV
jgi:thioredoxin reductase (NADPH)